MQEFWNERYRNEDYVYGKTPNRFFKESIRRLNITGRLLLPAEGEGRNAVHAAKVGLQVDAFDISEEGRRKTQLLAEESNVQLFYHDGSLETFPRKEHQYDAIALIYAHFPPEIRGSYHCKFAAMLRPGGHLILEAFHKKHLQYQAANPAVGGPKSEAMLLDETEIERDFKALQTLQLFQKEVSLQEGHGHVGTGLVLRYIGRKKEENPIPKTENPSRIHSKSNI